MISTPTNSISAPIAGNYRWSDVLGDKQISFLVLDAIHDRQLIEQLQTSPDWNIDFDSEEAIIFVRRERSC
jgi:hypothetical protein